jgi:transposase InsO family protein
VQLYGNLFTISYYCKLLGKSRQAFYEQKNQGDENGFKDALVLKLVGEIRQDLPRCGVDKLYYMLKEKLVAHGIKLGRDSLYKLMGKYGMLVRYRNRKPYTTNSYHHFKKYPNLIKNKTLHEAGQLWVSDITYIRNVNGFSYLSIITDAYSHKIVGYKLHPTLHADGVIDALIMANKDAKKTKQLIHHSDRGIQYCCKEYVQMITHFNIRLSMTEKGDPYENAIAERVNGILKYEFDLRQTFSSHQIAITAVHNAIQKYNEQRIHDSCSRLTPMQAHEEKGVLKKYWKPKMYHNKMEKEAVIIEK